MSLRQINGAAISAGYGFSGPGDAARPAAGPLRPAVSLRSDPPGMNQPFRSMAEVELAASRAMSLDVVHATRRYGTVTAVDDVSFAVAAGEIAALVGHSGSGKSTLLRLVAGLEPLDAGSIAIGGREVATASGGVPPEKRGVGMMFQDYALFPHLTAIRNVMFGLRGQGRAEARETALRALQRVGLAGRAEAFPHMLSGGEQQRVALARALAPRPGILLMDEPFSNLDRRTRVMVREDTFAVLRESGTTGILVTHDQDDAMRMADRILMMQGGRIVQGGTGEELCRRPATLQVARFFAEWNEIPATVQAGRASTPAGDFPAPGFADGTRVTVCMRPAGIRFGAAGETGRIVARHFLGDAEMVHVAVEGLAQPLRVIAPPGNGPAIGAEVRFTVAPDDVLVFPAG